MQQSYTPRTFTMLNAGRNRNYQQRKHSRSSPRPFLGSSWSVPRQFEQGYGLLNKDNTHFIHLPSQQSH